MNRTPRPPARVLLAGRYVTSRTALLAQPDGPVSGLDLATGELVGLAFGDGSDDPEAVRARIARADALGLAGSPRVRALRWHLGRPLVAFPSVASTATFSGDPLACAGAARALGDALDAAGLGLPGGAADLELAADGLRLRRPPIAAADPAMRLSELLSARAPALIGRLPARATPEPRPVRSVSRLALPASRRFRVGVLVVCAALSALVVSGLLGSSRDAPVARAAPPLASPSTLAAVPAPPVHVRVRHVVPPARGGPARVLLLPVVVAVRRPAVQAAAVVARASPPAREAGWVAGLFVGS